MPKVIYVETTNLCNAQCIMCPHGKMTRKKGTMSQHIFKTTIQAISLLDLSKVQLFLHKEGEPLLDPDIVERIHYTKKSLPGLNKLAINTNAMLLTEDISTKLLNSGLDTIYLSIDGATPQTYNNIRINLDYDKVVTNIRKFFLLKSKNKSKVKVIMQMLINDNNKHEVNLFKQIWKKEACEFYLKRMHCYLDGDFSSFPQKKYNKQSNVCEDPFNTFVIYIDGSVGVCCWDYDNQYKAGHITDNSLVHIFNNEKFAFLREKQINKDCSEIIPCNRCMRIYGNDFITQPLQD